MNYCQTIKKCKKDFFFLIDSTSIDESNSILDDDELISLDDKISVSNLNEDEGIDNLNAEGSVTSKQQTQSRTSLIDRLQAGTKKRISSPI